MSNGANVVLGQHPHVLQPVAFDGNELVAYSLGNFIWHYRSGITGDTGVLQIDFDRDQIVDWSFHPHLLDINGAPVPAAQDSRYERITDVISGDCAQHQPPPTTAKPPPETVPTTTTTEPETSGEPDETGDLSETDEPERGDEPETDNQP